MPGTAYWAGVIAQSRHLKIAVIADWGAVQRFARDALDAIEGTDEVTVFSCTNTGTRKRWLKHGLYYALNLLSVRNRFTRLVPVATGNKRIAREVAFASVYNGMWQVLPAAIIEELSAGGFDVVVKFGMGLLRVPPGDQLPVPILSYHHGDPDRYRGRPAGFWEIADRAPVMGQMVQVIGNRLDAGQVVAFAETKVFPWSWRATLMESFRHSPLIINTAIQNAISGSYLPVTCRGRNCRLPSNGTVAGFALRMAARFVSRLCYGAMFEKAWKVSTAPLAPGELPALLKGAFPQPSDWQTLPVSRRHLFYADPFFSRHGILVEALNGRSGLGEIVLVAGGDAQTVFAGREHMSYPATLELSGREYVVPETAQWSAPCAYVLKPQGLTAQFALCVENGERLIDPTLFAHDGFVYLFANIRLIGSNALFLWFSDRLEGFFRMHPASPVTITPRGGRMGGGLLTDRDRLIRFGQDLSGHYGDGLVAFDIERLTPDAYAERPVGIIRFTNCKGPHTLNFRPGEIVFDWYVHRFAPLAGWRRLLAGLRAGHRWRTPEKLSPGRRQMC